MNWVRVRKFARWVNRVVGVALLAVVALIAFPDVLFAYTLTTPRIVVLSDHPIDAAGARAVISDVEARLARSPLKLTAAGGPYRLIVTNEDWRRRLLFGPVYGVGGVAFYLLTHVFLSGADFAHDRLLRANGEAIDPPRTLGYYGSHELAHVLTGEKAGAVRMLTMPRWVVEGLADYCALGAPGDFGTFDAALGREPITVEQMKRFGVYPRWRMMVTFLLEERNWTLEQLLATDLSEEDVLAMLRGGDSR